MSAEIEKPNGADQFLAAEFTDPASPPPSIFFPNHGVSHSAKLYYWLRDRLRAESP